MNITINSLGGSVLFSGEFNSLADALTSAVRNGVNLRGAYLRYSDLRNAVLPFANLHGSYLRHASLCGASLCGSALYDADLSDADLSDADLRAVALRGAALRGAALRGAYLHGANLCDAVLCNADLRGANLCEADLSGAALRDADLRGANLHGANLRGADLRGANLHGAALHDANLHGADLSYSNLSGAKNADLALAKAVILPDGDIIGWKKCQGNTLVKLLVPAEARRSNGTGRKCRAEFAKVLEIIWPDGHAKSDTVTSERGGTYKVGEIVRADKWDEDRFNECSNGIHFFITRTEAEHYQV